MAVSPTLEGFRAAFRRPSLTLAEIMWRWVVGGTAATLFIFGLFEYFDTLPVTNGELIFLRTRHPYLVAEAIAHILRGSLNRAVMASLTAAMLLAALWIVAASMGRIATVRGLVDYFRRDAVLNFFASGWNGGEREASNVSTTAVAALLRIHFLRFALAVAAVLGFIGADILSGLASPAANPRPALAFSLFLPMAGLIGYLWWALNWLLSLAAMFAVRNGEDAVDAISSAAALTRERTGAVFAVTIWIGLAHLVAFVIAATIASVPLGFAGIVPGRLIIAAMIVAMLIYFVVADWLYLTRLAGYVCIAETPLALLTPQPPIPLPRAPALQTTIDRDEAILSDIQNLALET